MISLVLCAAFNYARPLSERGTTSSHQSPRLIALTTVPSLPHVADTFAEAPQPAPHLQDAKAAADSYSVATSATIITPPTQVVARYLGVDSSHTESVPALTQEVADFRLCGREQVTASPRNCHTERSVVAAPVKTAFSAVAAGHRVAVPERLGAAAARAVTIQVVLPPE
jgi:hypothetical protein